MRLAWLYFAFLAVLASPGRFTSVFLQAHGLHQSQVGILLAINPICELIATPFFCNFADIHNLKESTSIFLSSFALLFFCAQIIALPELGIVQGTHTLFLFFIVVRVLFAFFQAPCLPLMNSIVLSSLKQRHGHKGHELLGHVRLFGAISWALVSLAIGLFLDILSSSMIVVYIFFAACNLSYILCVGMFARSTRQIREGINSSSINGNDSTHENSTELSRKRNATALFLQQLFCSSEIQTPLFFNLIFWEAAGMSLVENLLFLFMQDELHSSNLLCGISVVITVIFEFPIFAKAPELLTSFGAPALAKIGALSYVLRAVMYALAPNAWFVLLAEPLHGVTFAMFCTASVAFISDRVPPELEATGQSMIAMVAALGRILGTFCGGFIIEAYGSHVLYAGASVLVSIAILAFHIAGLYSDRTCSSLNPQYV